MVPSTWYAKDDATIDALHQCLADDMGDLFHHGVSVKVQWQKHTVFFETPINSFIYVCFMIPKPDPEPTNVLLR